MRLLTLRTITVLASFAVIAGATLVAAESGGPTVVLSSTSTATTTAATIPVTATFSESVNGFTSGDVSVTNGAVLNFTGSSTAFTFDVDPTADGTVTVQVPADVADAIGDNHKGNQASNMLTFVSTSTSTPPTEDPVTCPFTISNITSNPATSSAMIAWNTSATTTGQVFFGTTTSYGSSTTLESTASTSHSASLSNLTPDTLYHFQISAGNGSCTATSTDMTFTTDESGTTTPLAITGVDAVRTTAIANGNFEDGWQWIIHFTVPDNETSMQLRFNDFMSSTTADTIPAANNIRYYSSQSSNATGSGSAIVETNNDYGGVMTLTGDTSTTTPGRQVDVTVDVRVPTGTDSGVYTTVFGARTQ